LQQFEAYPIGRTARAEFAFVGNAVAVGVRCAAVNVAGVLDTVPVAVRVEDDDAIANLVTRLGAVARVAVVAQDRRARFAHVAHACLDAVAWVEVVAIGVGEAAALVLIRTHIDDGRRADAGVGRDRIVFESRVAIEVEGNGLRRVAVAVEIEFVGRGGCVVGGVDARGGT